MKAILIFNNVNDLLFSDWDDSFIRRMNSLVDTENPNVTDTNSVVQLMSPIITSQRVMSAQFGNTYSSMQCKDGTNIVFDEWLGHDLILVSEGDLDDLHRNLLDCKTYIQHICGQNGSLLQKPTYSKWLSALLDSQQKADYIPGASGIIGESGPTATALNALKTASKDIKNSFSHYHLLLFVGDKMMALYSSRGCEDLTPPDIILLSTQCIAAQEYWAENNDTSANQHLPWLSEENSGVVYLCAGTSGVPCAPHSMHIAEIAPRILLVLVTDLELRETGVAMHLSSQILCNVKRILLQRNFELLPNTLDSLEAAIKRATEGIRKNKLNANLSVRLTTKMSELRKSCTTTTPLTPDTACVALNTSLNSVLNVLNPDIPNINISPALKELKEKLSPFIDFLQVKAMRYFGIESFVEEFPGLIHFVYIDRTSGRFIAPDILECGDLLSVKALRGVVSRALRLVREGYGAITWRGPSRHAAMLLWHERPRNTVAHPTAPPHPAAVRALSPPGDILGTFYKQLAELSFPNDSGSVVTKELICIHLGLVPAATALQQARRLAHTVLELFSDTPATDLL